MRTEEQVKLTFEKYQNLALKAYEMGDHATMKTHLVGAGVLLWVLGTIEGDDLASPVFKELLSRTKEEKEG